MFKLRSVRSVVLAGATAAMVALGAQPAAAQKTIRLAYVLAPVFLAPLVFQLDDSVLVHKGKSYNVEITKFRGTPQSLTALAAGEIDVAALAFSSFAAAIVNAHQDIRAIIDVAQDGPSFSTPFIVLQDSPIKKVTDLKGKVLAINAKGAGVDIAARSVLIKYGLRPGIDLSIIEAGFGAMDAMVRQHKADVVVMPAPFWATNSKKGGLRVLFHQRDGMGTTQFLLHAAKASFIKENRAVMVDFLEDFVRGQHWLMDPANREKAIDIAAKVTKRPRKAFESWLFVKGKDLYHSPNGYLDVKALQANVDLLKKFKILKTSFDVSKYVDHSLLDDAVARIK